MFGQSVPVHPDYNEADRSLYSFVPADSPRANRFCCASDYSELDGALYSLFRAGSPRARRFYCAQCSFSIACNNWVQWLKTTSKFMKRYVVILKNPKSLEYDIITSILHRRRYACAQCWRGNSCI